MADKSSNPEPVTRNSQRILWLTPAHISQLVFLITFLVLFVFTDYRGQDEISVAVNSFFRANPLVVVTYLLAVKGFTMLLFPGVVTILFSAILGRFFCGWICPLGTLIDLTTSRIRKTKPLTFLKGNFKYYLLFALLFAALFNVNAAGIFDPIAILIRFLTFFLYPLFGYTARQGWVGLYDLLGDNRDVLNVPYGFLKTYLLPFRETLYPLAFFSLIFFLFIFFLERYERRNWCRNLCPLGTLLGLIGSFSLTHRTPRKLCGDCGDCRQHCPTAFDEELLQKQGCILCMDCEIRCRFQRVRFRLKPALPKAPPFSTGRRVVLGGLASGFVLSRVFAFKPVHAASRPLRPPGVNEEGAFLAKCVRCGECMKVCPRNALYPATLETGLYGLSTPVLIPRLGYCEYNCNLCGQVCPTGAIPKLPVQQKQKAIIGLAVLDKNHCLPYAKKLNCIVCEEHCPIPNKAIRFEKVDEVDYNGKKVTLQRPYVVDELCNGCGICEYVCPLEEKAAIEVFPKVKRKIK
jgi:MauM/NapG family ferredoxin protein